MNDVGGAAGDGRAKGLAESVRHDAPWKRTLRRGVRSFLGVPEEESLGSYVGERGARAVRSLERLLQGLGIAPPPGSRDASHDGAGDVRVVRPEPKKFDLGPGIDRGPVREHIPWGYGENRVTAMPVDPDRLYAYWEVTDDAIEGARRGLGEAGATAWLSLRVYDVTGRIFDGTNAHAYFDHRVERHDRQWFFSLGRPGSTVCVDVGMKSVEGYFVRIARSVRVDLPRAWAAPPSPPEWMTVRAQTGEIEGAHQGEPYASDPATALARDAVPQDAQHAGTNGFARTATAGTPGDASPGARVDLVNGWHDGADGSAHEIRRRTEWLGDVERTSWEAGPFPHAVTPPVYEVTEQRSGESRTVTTPQGRVVLEQPWSVTIRGIGAHLARRVIGRWEIVRTLPTSADAEQARATPAAETAIAPAGGSESLLRRGASEVRLGAGSEERLGGASEEFLVGASELRFGGASERVFAGASESRWAGASERLWRGASELQYAGASERVVRGGSEERLETRAPGWQAAGASERLIGASELRLGASEQRLAGGSESRLGAPASERSARASWQAFAAAGSRLATPRADGTDSSDAAPATPATNGTDPASE